MPPSGYSFKSKLSFYEIRDRLAELGHGEWQERENDHYGTYIWGFLWGVRMRIYDGGGGGTEMGTYDPQGFMLLDYSRSAIDRVSDDQDRRIRELLLPKLEITEWKPDVAND